MRLVVLEVPGLPAGAHQESEFIIAPQNENGRSLWVVGRHKTCDIPLLDPSVSRRHAEITVERDGLLVRDLGSSNGTYVNNTPIPAQSAWLVKPGDRLRIGNVLTQLEAPTPEAVQSSNAGVQAASASAIAVAPALPKSGPIVDNLPLKNPANSQWQSPPSVATTAAMPDEEATYDAAIPASFPGSGNAQSYSTNMQFMPGAYARPGDEPAIPDSGNASLRLPTVLNRRQRTTPSWIWFLVGILLLMLIAAFAVWSLVNGNSSNNAPANTAAETIALPGDTFGSTAVEDKALGLALKHPENWKRSDSENTQVLFFHPDVNTIVLNIEKPPSRTITNASLNGEASLNQYLANVRQNSSSVEMTQPIRATRLKDGTAASLMRIIFTTSSAPVVTNYTLLAVAFRCSDGLYFVTAAAEGKDLTPAVRQDLDASVSSLTCNTGK